MYTGRKLAYTVYTKEKKMEKKKRKKNNFSFADFFAYASANTAWFIVALKFVNAPYVSFIALVVMGVWTFFSLAKIVGRTK